MCSNRKIIYTSQLDPTFHISVEPGLKSGRDFVVKSRPWPLTNTPPTHLDWVSLLLEQPQFFASEIVGILISAAELSYKNGPTDVVRAETIPPVSKHALVLWEDSPLKGKKDFLRDKSNSVLVPIDGFITVVTLIFVQEVNNYGKKALLHRILTYHTKQFFIEEDKEIREAMRREILMLADTKTWRSENKRKMALELREKLISRYLRQTKSH